MLPQIRLFSSKSFQRLSASLKSLSANPVAPPKETVPATKTSADEVAVDFNEKVTHY